MTVKLTLLTQSKMLSKDFVYGVVTASFQIEGGALAGWLLTFYGYQADTEQSDTRKQGLLLFFTILLFYCFTCIMFVCCSMGNAKIHLNRTEIG